LDSQVLSHRKIKVGKEYVDALAVKLLSKNLVLLWGKGGYVMCGYLNMSVAKKFKDVAVRVTSVSTIEDALTSKVSSCTHPAKKLGIYVGQPIRNVLKIIA